MQRFHRHYRQDPDASALTPSAVRRQGQPKEQQKSQRRWHCPSCGTVFRCEIRRGTCPKRTCTGVPEEIW